MATEEKQPTYRLSQVTGKRLPGKKELERKKVYLEHQQEIIRQQMLEWISPSTKEMLLKGV